MCGIVGYFCFQNEYSGKNILQTMMKRLQHRGPNDAGEWSDLHQGIFLGHRRLAIRDLSPLGKQPMKSPSGRYVLVYNGEVYNFLDLQKTLILKGHKFKGRSDTEVILATIEEWGIVAAAKKMVGMFAFAVWDRQEQQLTLCRDRIGEKPLYYGWQGKSFLFGSELKALQVFPGWQGEIDRNNLELFLRYSHVPEPFSIYKNIFKLPPGSLLTLSPNKTSNFFEPIPPNERRGNDALMYYWSLKEVAERGRENLFDGSEDEAVDELEKLLSDAIKKQMVADVPLGAFLSGGIDSSSVVALMQSLSHRPVKTFTIGFHEKRYNEAEFAKQIANHLGTDHTELYVTPEEAREVIPKLPIIYDEPFADSSQIPTFLISELARRSVAVSLSGDGGDELFGGYNRYFWGKSIWNKIGGIPQLLREVAAQTITTVSPSSWQSIYQFVSPLVPQKVRIAHPGDRIHKFAGILNASNQEEMYARLISFWQKPSAIVLGGGQSRKIFLTDRTQWANFDNFTEQMMFFDMGSYLPNDILVKVDRAAMVHSLETRLPMLDYNLVEFAWRLPLSVKIRDGQGKWVLRQLLYRYLPKTLLERPKMGFGVPIEGWLRGPLKSWAESLLNESRLKREGFFDPVPIAKKWKEHLSGKCNWQYLLWNVLMFQSWHEKNVKNRVSL